MKDSLIWKELTPELSPPRRDFASLCLVGDKVFMFGGQTEDAPGKYKFTNDLFVYDISKILHEPFSLIFPQIDANSWESIPTDTKALPPTGLWSSRLEFHKGRLFVYVQKDEFFLLTLSRFQSMLGCTRKINLFDRSTR